MTAVVPISDSQPKGLYAKLHAVMRDCEYIQKDKKNAFHGYRYASEAVIKERVHDALVKHGLMFIPKSASIVNRETGLGKDGKEALTTVRFAYRFADIESGESIEGEFDGVGVDSMDKGAYKAITGALKYILTSTFLIPTGDDPEDDSGDEKKSKEDSKADAKAIAERKIASLPAPEISKLSSDEQGLLDRIGTDRGKINAELSEMNLKLVNLLGNDSKRFISETLAKFKAKASTDLNIPQLRELSLDVHRKIRDAEAQIQPEPEDPELVILLDEITDIKSTIRVFNEIKFRLVGLVGEPKALEIYKRALAEQSKTASNQFQGDLEAAKKAFISLFNEYSALAREKLQAPA